VLYILYLDETGHAADHTKLHVGVAGLLAPIQSWEAFAPCWLGILDRFGVREPFHMLDFASRKNVFKTWSEPTRRGLLRALVDLIADTPNIRPLGVTVCMQALREIPEAQHFHLGSPYFIALENCIRDAVFGSIAEANLGNVPKIQVVLAKNVGYSGKGADLWEAMRRFDAIGVTGMFMDSIMIGTPEEHAALQAADLVAYETGKFFNYTLPQGKEPRWAYKRILSLHNCSLKHFGKRELHSSLDASGVTAQGLSYFCVYS
jgi:hypothetical protein